ncbi:hypothetical protein ACLB2K_040290 [Fragaria x ananassa]
MIPDVMQLFSNFDSPKAIWDSVAATYYDGNDFARAHELNELDQRNLNPMTCEADITSYRNEQDKMHVHVFLAGLDPHFEGPKNKLLCLATPLTLEQAFAYIRRDEANKTAAKTLHIEISGLAIHATPRPQPQLGNLVLIPSQNQYQPQNQGFQQNKRVMLI